MTGLAALTADLIQEGTKTKNSRQIRREVFGMGGSLTAGVVAGLHVAHRRAACPSSRRA